MKHIRFFRIFCAAVAAAMLTGCAVEADPAVSSSVTAVTTASDAVIAPPEQAASTLFGVPYRPTEIINPITDPVRMNRDLYTLVFDTLVPRAWRTSIIPTGGTAGRAAVWPR